MIARPADWPIMRFAKALDHETHGHTGRIVLVVALAALTDGIGLALLLPIVGTLVDPGRVPFARFAMGDWTKLERVAALVALFLCASLLRAALQFQRDKRLARLQASFTATQRTRIVRALASARWRDIVTIDHARVASLLAQDGARAGSCVQSAIQAVIAAGMILANLAVAACIAPSLTLAVAGLLAGAYFIGWRSRYTLLGTGNRAIAAQRQMMANTTTFLGGLKLALAEGAQGQFVTRFHDVHTRLAGFTNAFQLRQAWTRRMTTLGWAAAGSFVVLAGVAFDMSATALIASILILARISAPCLSFYQSVQTLLFNLPSFEAIGALEQELGAVPARTGPPTPEPARTAPACAHPVSMLAIERLRFRHPRGPQLAIDDLAFPTGTFIGLSGPSGGGKTTLLDLLAGLVEPDEGAVLVDGQPLTPERLEAWRARIAYVPQGGFLFHGTIRQNLLWGRTEPDPAILERALAVSGADQLIAGLEDGLDTVVGDRGGALSGGEGQRLAITRALLRDPGMLLLDESTSALDLASEAQVLERLAAWNPAMTIVLVAHRKESLARCEHIVRVENGRAARMSAAGDNTADNGADGAADAIVVGTA